MLGRMGDMEREAEIRGECNFVKDLVILELICAWRRLCLRFTRKEGRII